jgi:excinuclease ABC subunit B
MSFQLQSEFDPAGDQPKAIDKLVAGLGRGDTHQTLLGVTGSGKTFTMANVIQEVQRPTLVIAHNKTLAAQLCNEFREFFPENAVEYFVSYYDYYQPEAYIPTNDTYIEKEAMINDEIDRLRHAATQALLSREDVIIVASVSCIYGLGSPEEYERTVLHLEVDDPDFSRSDMMRELVDMQYERTNVDLKRGQFRARGNVVEIMPIDKEIIYRLSLAGEKIHRIQVMDHVSRKIKEEVEDVWVFPAEHYVVAPERKRQAINAIREELQEQLAKFEEQGKVLEAERLSQRTRYDLEMIEQIGYCNGIENYSRHFDGREPGEPPHTLIDYFPDDFLMIIDESHMTVPQIGGMYAGDQARKDNLIKHGFRLPSARDNRPLKFNEFEDKINQVVYTSATPGDYEDEHSTQVVEQIVRPTGLVDPEVIIRPVTEDKEENYPGQVDDLIDEIVERAERDERTLVTTLTKKMAEDLTDFLNDRGMSVQYLHSDIDTLQRIEILTDFRKGEYDVVVGVNLLREGLDLPEVTLVAILDADKEGFLRSEKSLIQTIGRAARNVDGQVILYADKMTGSLERAVDETRRRRKLQIEHNEEHNITPKTISKKIQDIQEMFGVEIDPETSEKVLNIEMVGDTDEIEDLIKEKELEMNQASKNLDFETAAILRDEIVLLKKELEKHSE